MKGSIRSSVLTANGFRGIDLITSRLYYSGALLFKGDRAMTLPG